MSVCPCGGTLTSGVIPTTVARGDEQICLQLILLEPRIDGRSHEHEEHTRISGDERRGDERRGDERLYLGLLFTHLCSAQLKHIEHKTFYSRQHLATTSYSPCTRSARAPRDAACLDVCHSLTRMNQSSPSLPGAMPSASASNAIAGIMHAHANQRT